MTSITHPATLSTATHRAVYGVMGGLAGGSSWAWCSPTWPAATTTRTAGVR